ncbi:hypothetical protein UFOVP1462_49 [uncultured Caudovirales phage]|uniref:Glycine-rich domain-containing protein n=1 Tax=uncultured Caudovirales phage TaxID=2100421 RepID=A0A6J5Q1Y0_9CAUD|nr:hypothetical protein UFOVP1013_49 [uncultured Caudovirales phage]CAB4202424.1 hypothetical protein UFOVP1364_11 [uncultured Caudovirales phage]CAB4214583.1 hypothetical protein UFOVP1462_49 [uncultured Caudovirales phage]CAB5228534.1 hypothetical protein UFOVP1550_3 [uncultured Caudovirales phage]
MANETYTLIQRTVLNASAASITLSSIPQTFTDLVIKISGRTTYASPYGEGIYISFNGLNTNMARRRLYGLATGSGGSDNAANSYAAYTSAASQSANAFGNSELYITNYTSSGYKLSYLDGGAENNAATAGLLLNANTWSATAAISSITLTPETGSNFVQYTSVSLYGVAKQGVTPTGIPKASGGNVVTNDGTYWIHQFTGSGLFTPSQNLSCGYLVVAGGASGGAGYGGGGGAGGLRSSVTNTGGGGSLESALSVTAGVAYTVTIGAGGAAGTAGYGNDGNNGVDSTFSSITSTGGGKGVGGVGAGGTGGSGGGGADGGAGGARTTNQGFAGGASVSGFPYFGTGGGGGAGAVGADGNVNNAGAGGIGVQVAITGSSVYYAGGGGGGTYSNTGSGPTGAAGGAGGGGAGGLGGGANNGIAGTASTGSGGGGGSAIPYTSVGGAGGSGVVIIRYLM